MIHFAVQEFLGGFFTFDVWYQEKLADMNVSLYCL